MCGRFTLTADRQALQEAFPWLELPPQGLNPRYNIAPTQPIAVVANTGENRLGFFVWGLIPSWAKDASIGSRLINARAETLAEKPSFRAAFRRRRCLILADGFYEWQLAADGRRKMPFYFHLARREPFAFAGLWDLWHSPDGAEIRSAAIITTQPNARLAAIHNRMPVILRPEHYRLWLDPAEHKGEDFAALLQPYPAEAMSAYPVSPIVNNPEHDTPDCLVPAE